MYGKARIGPRTRRYFIAVSVAFVLLTGEVSHSRSSYETKKDTMTNGKSLYCNTKALNPSERKRHQELTDKLVSMSRKILETERGYEFQYDPSQVTLTELAAWVTSEGKCCPFFDFHIDLEQEGKLLCLRLAGPEGVKAFIRMEFHVAPKQ
jgi:hypothetical protein